MADNEIPDLTECPEKQALIDQIRDAMNLAHAIQNEELEETIGGSAQRRDWYAKRLREATERRMSLIDRLGRHVGEHKC